MRCYEGGQTIEIPVTMASIPMFIREGAVIAMADNQLMTMEGDHTNRPPLRRGSQGHRYHHSV